MSTVEYLVSIYVYHRFHLVDPFHYSFKASQKKIGIESMLQLPAKQTKKITSWYAKNDRAFPSCISTAALLRSYCERYKLTPKSCSISKENIYGPISTCRNGHLIHFGPRISSLDQQTSWHSVIICSQWSWFWSSFLEKDASLNCLAVQNQTAQKATTRKLAGFLFHMNINVNLTKESRLFPCKICCVKNYMKFEVSG